MKLEIWSDVVCPWCYVGKRHLEAALAEFAHRDAVTIEWKSYELDPHAPPLRPGTYVDRLSQKYGISPEDARARTSRIISVGADAGIDFRFDDARPGNTFNAHRLLHLAASRGLQDELKERLLRATFTEGRAIGDDAVLRELAVEVGLPEPDVSQTLEGTKFGDDVRADEREATQIGITGVPFFVFDRTYAVSGAQPPAVLLDVLERVWREKPVELIATDGDGVCEDGACEL